MAFRFGFGAEWNHLGQFIGQEPAAPYFADAGESEPCAWFGGHAGVRLPTDGHSDWLLELELFVVPDCAPGSWVVQLNGREAGVRIEQGAQVLRLRIAAADGARGICELMLRGPTFRPGAEGKSPDRRELGLLLRRATLSRVGPVAVGHSPQGSPHGSPQGSPHDSPPGSSPGLANGAADAWRLHAEADIELLVGCLRRCGAGGFIEVPDDDLPVFAAVLFAASAHRSRLVAGARDFPQPDGVRDGVCVARLGGRLLVYNGADAPITKRLYPAGPARPESVQIVHLEPREMRWVLDGEPAARVANVGM
jgi:hypothetical protein